MDINHSRRMKWSTADVPWAFSDVVTGVLHVDDMAVFSKVWCAHCLTKKLKKMFPSDIGLNLEEQGPTLRILSVIIHVENDSTLRVFPNNPNVWFGFGLQAQQSIMRVGQFYSTKIQKYSTFASYFVGQLLMYDRLVGGDADGMFLHTCCLILEFLRLGWPQHYITNSMQSVPRRHQSPFVTEVRRLGRRIRQEGWEALFEIKSLSREAIGHPLHGRIFDCMATRKQEKPAHAEMFPFTQAWIRALFGRHLG